MEMLTKEKLYPKYNHSKESTQTQLDSSISVCSKLQRSYDDSCKVDISFIGPAASQAIQLVDS